MPMSDIADKAQEEIEMREALKKRQNRFLKKTGIKSRTHCKECAKPIPAQRQEAIAGVQKCVECQAEEEK